MNKKFNRTIETHNLLSQPDIAILSMGGEIPLEAVNFFDSSVEYLYLDNERDRHLTHLKFFGKEEIILSQPEELVNYLSSGSIKGIIVFSVIKQALKTGGYLLIDDIESHFNGEIVSTIIRLFIDSRFNKNGAILIYTAHNPHLLDLYDRNDSLYIVRNRAGITIENLSSILKRNEVKKSEAYQSCYLKGTAPSYDAYIKLKQTLYKSTDK